MSTQQIQSIPLTEFVVDIALSGRSQSELEGNAKTLAPLFEAAGGWIPRWHGAYFMRDNQKHLCEGFTRYQTAKDLKLESGYFVEVDDDPHKLRIACITSNSGKPVSAFEQGKIYAAMRDGSHVSKLKQGEVALEPMSIKDIAKSVGYSFVHITNCISIAESTPEIGALILADKISANVAIKAKQLIKDDKQRLRMLEAAILEAEIDEKPRASESHLDKVKHRFLPKPKAVEEPKKESSLKGTKVANLTTPEPVKPLESSQSSAPIQNSVLSPSEHLPLEPAAGPPIPQAKNANKLLPAFRKCIEEFSNIETPEIAINDGQILRLSQALIAIVVSQETPF